MKLPELVYQARAVTIVAVVSAIGMLIHTPSVPNHRGRINKQGTRNSICRVSERKIAFLDIPMERKKFVATIWKPTIGKTAKTICKPYTAASISSGSVVNMRTITDGNN